MLLHVEADEYVSTHPNHHRQLTQREGYLTGHWHCTPCMHACSCSDCCHDGVCLCVHLTFSLSVELSIVKGVEVKVEEDAVRGESCDHIDCMRLWEGQSPGQLLETQHRVARGQDHSY